MADYREAFIGIDVAKRVRHMLVESTWTYRHPPKVGASKLYRLEQAPPKLRKSPQLGQIHAALTPGTRPR